MTLVNSFYPFIPPFRGEREKRRGTNSFIIISYLKAVKPSEIGCLIPIQRIGILGATNRLWLFLEFYLEQQQWEDENSSYNGRATGGHGKIIFIVNHY